MRPYWVYLAHASLGIYVHLVQQPDGDGLPESQPFLTIEPVVDP